MKKVYILFLLLFLVACKDESSLNDLSQNGEIARQFVENLGYEVVAYEGEDRITFLQQDMGFPPNKQFWSVQTVEPTNYLDKELVQIKFLVKNHPLANTSEVDKTELSIVIWNDEVIGGTSFPYSTEPLIGGSYSIDGKSGEDVKANYVEWSKKWDIDYDIK